MKNVDLIYNRNIYQRDVCRIQGIRCYSDTVSCVPYVAQTDSIFGLRTKDEYKSVKKISSAYAFAE